MSNTKGRLAEAYTGSTDDKITDLGFSYTLRGEISDVYQKSRNSGGYYHVAAQYWAHGAVSQISGVPGLPTINYTDPDGAGNITKVSTGSGGNQLVTGVTYNTAGSPTQVTLGSGDSNNFSYDANTNRPTQYRFTINQQDVKGDLTWNPNGTLLTLTTTDPFNPDASGSCAYTYDDLLRLKSVDCGSPWQQTFTYDPFGNINKSGNSSLAATLPAANNRIAGLSYYTYDNNGNVTNDGVHAYGWNADGQLSQIDGGATPTYDALSRMVEDGKGNQMLYGPNGSKLAVMNGQVLKSGFVPLPGGATAVFNASGLAYYRHPDWLGSARFASTPTAPTGMYSSKAYAPFGEVYGESGTPDHSFAGHDEDTASGLYDAWFRRYSPAQSRWLSPDPAGLSAVNIYNPQSWNRYAYVLNSPLDMIDPLGLDNDCGGPCVSFSYTAGHCTVFVSYTKQSYGGHIYDMPRFEEACFEGGNRYRRTVTEWDDMRGTMTGRRPQAAPANNDANSLGNGTYINGDFLYDANGSQLGLNPTHGMIPTNIEFDVLLAGKSVLDTAKMGNSFLFGNRSGLNAADSLRIGWSWVRDGQYWRFRVTGSWIKDVVPGGHINLWPPSLFPFKRP